MSVSVNWLAVKTASEMTYIVSSGALNSTPTPTPVVVMTTAGHVTRQPIAVSDHGLVNWQLTGRRVEPDLKRLGFELI